MVSYGIRMCDMKLVLLVTASGIHALEYAKVEPEAWQWLYDVNAAINILRLGRSRWALTSAAAGVAQEAAGL